MSLDSDDVIGKIRLLVQIWGQHHIGNSPSAVSVLLPATLSSSLGSVCSHYQLLRTHLRYVQFSLQGLKGQGLKSRCVTTHERVCQSTSAE